MRPPLQAASLAVRSTAPAAAVQMIQVDTELVARSRSGVVPCRVNVAQPSSRPKAVTAERARSGESRRIAVVVAMRLTIPSVYTCGV